MVKFQSRLIDSSFIGVKANEVAKAFHIVQTMEPEAHCVEQPMEGEPGRIFSLPIAYPKGYSSSFGKSIFDYVKKLDVPGHQRANSEPFGLSASYSSNKVIIRGPESLYAEVLSNLRAYRGSTPLQIGSVDWSKAVFSSGLSRLIFANLRDADAVKDKLVHTLGWPRAYVVKESKDTLVIPSRD